MMRGAERAATVALFGFGLGCGESLPVDPAERGMVDYVEAYCSSMASCECEERTFERESDCRDWLLPIMQRAWSSAREAGLTYDDDCLRTHIATIQRTGCESAPPVREACLYMHGDVAEGEICTDAYGPGTGRSDCAQGLECHGRCFDLENPSPAFVLEDGDPCYDPATGPLGVCADGLHCSGGIYICMPIPSLDQPCRRNEPCLEGWCNVRCVPHRADGEACSNDLECQSSSRCSDGVCAPWPGPLCLGVLY